MGCDHSRFFKRLLSKTREKYVKNSSPKLIKFTSVFHSKNVTDSFDLPDILNYSYFSKEQTMTGNFPKINSENCSIVQWHQPSPVYDSTWHMKRAPPTDTPIASPNIVMLRNNFTDFPSAWNPSEFNSVNQLSQCSTPIL